MAAIKWEYRETFYTSGNPRFISELNFYGAHGWELVCIINSKGIMKRRDPEFNNPKEFARQLAKKQYSDD